MQKDILRHPRYQPGGVDALTVAQQTTLKKARLGDEASISSLNALAASNPADHSYKVWSKILLGEEDYVDYIPLVTQTTTYRYVPDNINSGAGFMVGSPPSDANPPDGYQWLQTADTVTRNGYKWTVKLQWTGAIHIDSDLYTLPFTA